MRTTRRITFEEVKLRMEKSLPCPNCEKKVKRTKTFTQTINPFNKRPDGTIKDRETISAELQDRAAKWQQEAELCGKCDG